MTGARLDQSTVPQRIVSGAEAEQYLEMHEPEEVLELMQEYGISARLTFSNSLLREEHLGR